MTAVFAGVILSANAEPHASVVAVGPAAALFCSPDETAPAALAARAPILPAGRAGSQLTPARAAALLAVNAVAFADRLRWIGARAEFVVAIAAPTPQETHGYLQSRRAALRALDAAAQRVLSALGDPPAIRREADLSVLWPVAGAAAFRAALAPLAAPLGLRASGPWPPYSFAALDAAEAA